MLKVTGKVKDANRETDGPKAVCPFPSFFAAVPEKKNYSFNMTALYCSPKHKPVHVDKVGKLDIMDKSICKQESSLCHSSFR